jgi:hypothetical protein
MIAGSVGAPADHDDRAGAGVEASALTAEVSMTKPKVRIERVYDHSADQDGMRVLVGRLWPRGLTKARAALEERRKPVAPSPELRAWYAMSRSVSRSSGVATTLS